MSEELDDSSVVFIPKYDPFVVIPSNDDSWAPHIPTQSPFPVSQARRSLVKQEVNPEKMPEILVGRDVATSNAKSSKSSITRRKKRAKKNGKPLGVKRERAGRSTNGAKRKRPKASGSHVILTDVTPAQFTNYHVKKGIHMSQLNFQQHRNIYDVASDGSLNVTLTNYVLYTLDPDYKPKKGEIHPQSAMIPCPLQSISLPAPVYVQGVLYVKDSGEPDRVALLEAELQDAQQNRDAVKEKQLQDELTLLTAQPLIIQSEPVLLWTISDVTSMGVCPMWVQDGVKVGQHTFWYSLEAPGGAMRAVNADMTQLSEYVLPSILYLSATVKNAKIQVWQDALERENEGANALLERYRGSQWLSILDGWLWPGVKPLNLLTYLKCKPIQKRDSDEFNAPPRQEPKRCCLCGAKSCRYFQATIDDVNSYNNQFAQEIMDGEVQKIFEGDYIGRQHTNNRVEFSRLIPCSRQTYVSSSISSKGGISMAIPDFGRWRCACCTAVFEDKDKFQEHARENLAQIQQELDADVVAHLATQHRIRGALGDLAFI